MVRLRSVPLTCLVYAGLHGVCFAQTTATNLLGPVWGVRPWLAQSGVSVGLNEISELFGNATGGIHTGADYDGLTELSLGVDLGRAIGLKGGTFNVSAFQIHGRSLSQDNLDDIDTISGIEASRATRLWEIWYDQQFRDGQYDIKIGQQSLDQEYITSASAGVFANTAFGWPALPSFDMYAGGPAYPLSSLGVRVRGNQGPFTALLGVYDDNPPGGAFDNDSQTNANKTGALFSLNTGALVIGEVDYALNTPSLGDAAKGGAAAGSGLPGVYKIGAWYDSGAFPDQRYDDQGGLLASPDSDGQGLMRQHDYAFYGVADQMIWRPDPNGPRSLNIFTRLMGGPGDRNLIDFASNLGLVLKDPLPGRDNDTLGFAGGFTKIGRNALEHDHDFQTLNPGVYAPLRSSESYLELTYQYVPVGWLTVQPDLQYTFMPGGGIANPDEPNTRVSNEFVLGVRSTIVF
ncbi:carbohydrate porin [Lichenicola sp.]|uniref:carbohydrate porin n=1 Tax=Lichenicola sp. TaxID=2804529 RepID=UPI003B00E86A